MEINKIFLWGKWYAFEKVSANFHLNLQEELQTKSETW